MSSYLAIPDNGVHTTAHRSETKLWAGVTIVGALCALAGAIWAGAAANSSLDVSAFQPLHLTIIGAFVMTVGANRLANSLNYSGKTWITVALVATMFLGVAAATCHSLDGGDALTYIATGAASVALLAAMIRLGYDYKKHKALIPRHSSFEGNG